MRRLPSARSGRLIFTDWCNPHANAVKIRGDEMAVQPSERSHLAGIETKRNRPDYLSGLGRGHFITEG